MSLAPGTKLGPYEVLSQLGVGGMGEVWRARDTRLGREVALKVLPETVAGDREVIARFQREAQLLATFNHTNIASIHSFERADGVQLLVMEMVPGETVRELLAAGPLPLPRALDIARQTAEALEAAHAKGILHRDLKPANVKVTPEGRVKLLDFGLAKAFAPASEVSDLSESPTLGATATRSGTVLGTVPYMSPEQARGRTLDQRSDVWSFGCLLYEMLAGHKTFPGDSQVDILVAILERKPDWNALPKETPPRIQSLLAQCLSKDPESRAPDMSSVRRELELSAEEKSPGASRSIAAVSVRIPGAPRFWAGAGALLAAVIAVLAVVSFRGKEGTALPASKLLAILPATDLTGRSDGRQLCDGFSVSLRSKLRRVPGVSIMLPAAARLETDAAKVAHDTGANLILVPSARRSGDQVQLSYSLALAASPVQIDAGEVTGPESEWFRLENELSEKICASLDLARGGSPPVREEITRGPSQSEYVVALGCIERIDDAALLKRGADLLENIPGGNRSALVQAALGRAYLLSFALTKDAGAAERAKAAAARALALDPGLPEAQVTTARLSLATGRPAEALPIVRKVLEKSPGDVEALAVLAAALQGVGDFAGAETTWTRIVTMRPTSWSAYKDLAGFFFFRNRYDEAARAYQKAMDLNPDAYGLPYSLGAVRIRQGRFDEAIGALRRSIEIKPSALAYSNLGACQYLLGDFAGATDSFGKAITLTPGDYRYHVYLGDALTFAPGRAEKAKQAYEEAIPLAESVLRVNPRDGRATGLLALCKARTGRTEEAARLVARAVALEPENATVLERAAIVNLALARRDEALTLLEQAVARGYGSVEFRSDPEFSSLRNEPRFQLLLSGVGGAGAKQN